MKVRSGIVLTLALIFLSVLNGKIAKADEVAYDSGGRRNPFIPLTASGQFSEMSAGSKDLRLEGVIYDPRQQSLAIFSGKAYREGEKIGEVVILKIYKNKVDIRTDTEEQTLWLHGDEKNPAEAE